jgi:hypothetical protein
MSSLVIAAGVLIRVVLGCILPVPGGTVIHPGVRIYWLTPEKRLCRQPFTRTSKSTAFRVNLQNCQKIIRDSGSEHINYYSLFH